MSRALIGRAQEIAAVARAVDAAAGGRGSALALVGEAGIGKSRLRREAERQACERGLLLLSGRAIAADSPEPFRPLTEALTGAFRETGPPRDPSLLPLRPTLAHLVADWSERRAREISSVAIAEALLRLLQVAAADRGAMLVIEDAQWADADTLAVVEYLMDNADAHGTLVLLTLRPQPSTSAVQMVRRLADQRAAVVLDLTPLRPGEVDELVLSCLRQDAVSVELLSFVRERADGVPFFVEELLAGLVRSGGLVRSEDGWQVVGHRLTSTVPVTLADSVARRFHALHDRTQNVLFAAALLGRSFDWRLLTRVTGLDEDVVLASLREATYAQLLTGDGDSVRFRHALTRDQVIGLMLPPERARLATRAVAAITEAHPGMPGGWRELAAELAELAGDHDQAVEHLLTAADHARDRGALATAITRLERARALAHDPHVMLGVEESLAQARALAGDVEGARDLGVRALRTRRARGDAPDREIDLELTLGRAAVTAGRCDEAREHAEHAIWRASDLGDAARRARAVALASQAAIEGGDLDTAEHLAAEAIQAAGEDLPEVRCEALEVIGRCARVHDVRQAETAFEAALATADACGLTLWSARALHELGTIDLLETMRTDRLQAARRAAIEAGALVTAAVVDFHLASALVARDEIVGGREAAERAVSLAGRLKLAILPFALVTLAASYGHERRADCMESLLEQALTASRGDPAVEAAAWGHARMMLALHNADREAVCAALDRAIAVLRRCPDQHFPYRGLWALLRTLADDSGKEARQEAAGAAGRGSGFNRALLYAAEGVAAGRSGASDQAARNFETALEILRGYQGGDWLVHAIRWLIAPAARTDGWGEPIAWLQDALRWFAAHGYGPLATSCRLLLREVGAPIPRGGRGESPVPDALRAQGVTSRETDVLRLITERLTNREIAERLVLSPKTVEKHVANLLQKTGAADREALAALARLI